MVHNFSQAGPTVLSTLLPRGDILIFDQLRTRRLARLGQISIDPRELDSHPVAVSPSGSTWPSPTIELVGRLLHAPTHLQARSPTTEKHLPSYVLKPDAPCLPSAYRQPPPRYLDLARI